MPAIGRRSTRPGPTLALALALAACTRVPDERTSDSSVPEAPTSPDPTPAPVPTRVVGAAFRLVAEIPEPITSSIAFGPDAASWWHFDGEQATAWTDAEPHPTKLDAVMLLAAGPRPPAGHPLAIGTTLVTANGTRPLHEQVAFALRGTPAPWGYAGTGATFSADGTLLLVTQEWHPSACCRADDRDSGPEPPRHLGLLYDTTTGTRTELPGVLWPSLLGRERLVLSGPHDALYSREPLYPLDAGLSLGWTTRALALGVDEQVIATTVWAEGGKLRLGLLRARDGMRLHEWDAPTDVAALAFAAWWWPTATSPTT